MQPQLTDTGVEGGYYHILSGHFAQYFTGMNSSNSYNRKVNTTAGPSLEMQTLGIIEITDAGSHRQ